LLVSAIVAADATVRLVGAPPSLTGTVLVANETEPAMMVETLEASLHADDGTALPGTLRIVGRAASKARGRVRIQLVVGVMTPPGIYRGEAVVNGALRPVEARVLELRRASIAPSTVSLRAPAGAAIETELIATNDGNVPYELPKSVAAWFEETDWLGEALVIALRDTGAQEGVQAYLDRVVHTLRNSMGGTTTLTVAADAALAPGAQTVIRLSGTVPSELIEGRSYVASLSLAGGTVSIEVDVTPAVNSTKRRPA
jgi:hypothetical protein